MSRPRGGRTADWARIDHDASGRAIISDADKWISEIKIWGNGFGYSATSVPSWYPTYFYEEVLYKVQFRSIYRTNAVVP